MLSDAPILKAALLLPACRAGTHSACAALLSGRQERQAFAHNVLHLNRGTSLRARFGDFPRSGRTRDLPRRSSWNGWLPVSIERRRVLIIVGGRRMPGQGTLETFTRHPAPPSTHPALERVNAVPGRRADRVKRSREESSLKGFVNWRRACVCRWWMPAKLLEAAAQTPHQYRSHAPRRDSVLPYVHVRRGEARSTLRIWLMSLDLAQAEWRMLSRKGVVGEEFRRDVTGRPVIVATATSPLLRRTRALSVAEVALRCCGFRDPSRFHKVFKERTRHDACCAYRKHFPVKVAHAARFWRT